MVETFVVTKAWLSSADLTCWLAEWEEELHAGAQQAAVTPQ